MCAFLWTNLFLGFSRSFGCCSGSAPKAAVGVRDQDGTLVPRARPFLRSILGTENLLARATAFARVEGQLRSPKQDILFSTLIHLFLICNVFLRFINQ